MMKDCPQIKMTPWVRTLLSMNSASHAGANGNIAHFFTVDGNINDWQPNEDGEYVSLHQNLLDLFKQRNLVMIYSASSGLRFATEEMEILFRHRFLSPTTPPDTPTSAVARSKQKLASAEVDMSPLGKLIGESPNQVLKFLEPVLLCPDIRSVLIVDYAQYIVPNDPSHSNGDRIIAELFERWSRDRNMRSTGNIVVLVAPSSGSINSALRGSQSAIVEIHIPKPDQATRTARWQEYCRDGLCLTDGLTPEVLGNISNGLSLMQMDMINMLLVSQNIPLTFDFIRRQKQEILQAEFGDILNISTPQYGLEYFGGKPELKSYFLRLRDRIQRGGKSLKHVPMGILAVGPQGTGKTFLLKCWAHDCGFNFVEIVNPRNMYVGESESQMNRILSALRDLAPVIVVEDEADQSEGSRDDPSGDAGTSNRLRQMKFNFTSDPANRGRVIWIRISNRPDLIDAAYLREGRTDVSIPFLMPEAGELEDIFKVMFKRYDVQCDISDLKPFAARLAANVYCTGSSMEWIVLKASEYADDEDLEIVSARHLERAIANWEPKNTRETDRRIIIAIECSDKEFCPANWEEILHDAELRFQAAQINQLASQIGQQTG